LARMVAQGFGALGEQQRCLRPAIHNRYQHRSRPQWPIAKRQPRMTRIETVVAIFLASAERVLASGAEAEIRGRKRKGDLLVHQVLSLASRSVGMIGKTAPRERS